MNLDYRCATQPGCYKKQLPGQQLFPEHRKYQEAKQHNKKRCEEHENGDTVHTMHVFHPLRSWFVRISFFDVEVLRDLTPNAHR
jgi:hypothetical protein